MTFVMIIVVLIDIVTIMSPMIVGVVSDSAVGLQGPCPLLPGKTGLCC